VPANAVAGGRIRQAAMSYWKGETAEGPSHAPSLRLLGAQRPHPPSHCPDQPSKAFDHVHFFAQCRDLAL
jgi:hypothetical protein